MTEEQFEALVEWVTQVAQDAVLDPFGESQQHRVFEKRLRELLVDSHND